MLQEGLQVLRDRAMYCTASLPRKTSRLNTPIHFEEDKTDELQMVVITCNRVVH